MKRTVIVAVALAAMFGAVLWNVGEPPGATCAATITQKQRRACERHIAAAAREADAKPAPSRVVPGVDPQPRPSPT